MDVTYSTLLQRDVPQPDHERTIGSTRPFAKDNKEHPNIVTYGHLLCPYRALFTSRILPLPIPPPAWAETTPSFSLSFGRLKKSTGQSRSSISMRISIHGYRGPNKSASRTVRSSISRAK